MADVTTRNRRQPLGFYLSTAWLGLCVLAAVFGGLLPLPDWSEFDYDNLGVGLFTNGHILGTDGDGVDLLSAIINGSRLSLTISIVSVVIGIFVGGLLGVTAAYLRGKPDTVITTYFNVSLAIPTLILALALVSVFATPPSDGSESSTVISREPLIIFALALVLIPVLGRIARASALSWAGRDFILVAQSMGMKRWAVLRHHIIPNVVPTLLSVALLATGVLIVVEGGLAILGAGVVGGGSWGSLLAKNRGDLSVYPMGSLLPAMAIALTVMSVNYYADYVRTRIDKRQSRI
jgi:peptide/nickel transport system permease protein